jgi:hypothetical protein
LLKDLERDEQQAGQFICEIMDNNIPGAVLDLGEDIWNEIEDDWVAVRNFVLMLPELVPELLSEIVKDGEDVVSIIEAIVINPQAALTIIQSDVQVIISDTTSEGGAIIGEITSIGGDVASIVTSVGRDIGSFFKCLFDKKKCQHSSTSTPFNPAATLSSSCQVIKAAATTTFSATDPSTIVAINAGIGAATSYPAPQTGKYVSQPGATSTSNPALVSNGVDANTACAFTDDLYSRCSSMSPQFATDGTVQAECMCYSEVNPTSTDWRPDILSSSADTCVRYLSTTLPASASLFSQFEDFCSGAGDVVSKSQEDSTQGDST